MAAPDRHRAEPEGTHPGRGIVFLFPAVIWAVYFVVIYSTQGAACADGGASRGLLIAMTAAAALAIAAVGVWGVVGWRRLSAHDHESEATPPTRAGFLAFATITHAALFLVATLWVGAATVVLDPCAGHITDLQSELPSHLHPAPKDGIASEWRLRAYHPG